MNLPAGLAADFLRDWDLHARSFIPEMVRRPDFNEWVQGLESRLLAGGEDPLVCRQLTTKLRNAQEADCGPLSQRLIDWLRAATDRDLAETFEPQDILIPVEGSIMQWPTGILRLDAMTGGGYGLTVFGGQPKMGKSLAALGAGLTAACNGWNVFYINAELTQREMYERGKRFMAAAGCDPVRVAVNFSAFNAHPGFEQAELLDELAHTVSMDTDRILIVLDSVNRLADNDMSRERGEMGFYDTLRRWCEWPRLAVRLSEGRISFLVVSELTRKDQIKGAHLEYAANMVVRFTGHDDDNTRVNIDVALSRETRSGDCGDHERDWRKAMFVRNERMTGGAF